MDRDKGDFKALEGQTVTLQDAYKLTKDGETLWAFIIEESEDFYFANASLARILQDAEDLAADEDTSLAAQLCGVRVHIGTLETGKKGRIFRPVDIVD